MTTPADDRCDYEAGNRAYHDREPFDPAKPWEWKRGWMIAWTESNKRTIESEVSCE